VGYNPKISDGGGGASHLNVVLLPMMNARLSLHCTRLCCVPRRGRPVDSIIERKTTTLNAARARICTALYCSRALEMYSSSLDRQDRETLDA
jgi:hypothetical protein